MAYATRNGREAFRACRCAAPGRVFARSVRCVASIMSRSRPYTPGLSDYDQGMTCRGSDVSGWLAPDPAVFKCLRRLDPS
jgi:hypothetical protein